MKTDREKRAGAGKAPPSDPTKFAEAIDAFRRRDVVTDDELDVLTETERERAFWVSGVAEADVVQQVWDAVDAAIENGTPIEEFRASVTDALEDAWGGPKAYRVDTIFRTNLGGAYSAGRYETMTAPEVLEARPYWTIRVVEDSRTSDICRELDEKKIVLPADDPFWKTHVPPFHHCCRSEIAALTPEEAAARGIADAAPRLQNEPDDGFGGAPSVTGADWVPEAGDYSDQIGDVLRDRLDL